MLGIIFEKTRNTIVCPDEKTLFEGDYFLITICKDMRPPTVVCRDSNLQLLLFCEKYLYFFSENFKNIPNINEKIFHFRNLFEVQTI